MLVATSFLNDHILAIVAVADDVVVDKFSFFAVVAAVVAAV